MSLIIPAYNEQSRIRHALDRYLAVLEASGRPFEVIVVIDGTDGTPEVVESYRDRRVIAVHSPSRLGKGGAILEGFGRARFDVAGYVDADGSLDPTDLRGLIDHTEEADCVVASRWLPGSVWRRKEPLAKRFLSRGFNILVRGLLGLPLSDTQCGAKFFRSAVLRRVLPNVTVTNLTIDVGVLYHTRRAGFRIREVPVTWDDDSRSRFRLGRMTALMLVTLIGIRLMNLRSSHLVPKSLVSLFARTIGRT